MPRKCFFSFHYLPDAARALAVRQTGAIDGSTPIRDVEWQAVVEAGDAAIRGWVATQLVGKSCTVVLIGAATANRKWITYEIIQSWQGGKGLVGLHVHGLENAAGTTTKKGSNPFASIAHVATQGPLSSIVKCYDPPGIDCSERRAWIADHLGLIVKEAIAIRKANS
jgi:MTH538 TIR-like domain (DUF1863)